MSRVIRFLGVLPLLVLSAVSNPRLEVPEPGQISNWPAPPYWTPPATARAPGEARTEAVSAASAPLPFVAMPPCRIADTRNAPGPYGAPALIGGSPRSFSLAGQCGIPAGAGAVSLNATVTNTQGPGFILIYAEGDSQPGVSNLNYVAGQTIANAAVVKLGTGGGVNVLAAVSGTDFIMDVNGYYDGSGSLQLSLSRRAALDQFWTPQNDTVLGLTTVGSGPQLIRSDGADLWVANVGGSVSRVRGSDGKLLETWTGATNAFGVLVAMGRVFVTGQSNPGQLYQIDPSHPPTTVTTVASNLGGRATGIAFDGARIWTANLEGGVSLITPSQSLPWSSTNVTTGLGQVLGLVYDGQNMWATEPSGRLLRLDTAGGILQEISLPGARVPTFDGTNIWIPNLENHSVTVVRATGGEVLATLTGNGLQYPFSSAFDGWRVLVTNPLGNRISLWRASDLQPLGNIQPGSSAYPFGACSDGINFWITLNATNQIARF